MNPLKLQRGRRPSRGWHAKGAGVSPSYVYFYLTLKTNSLSQLLQYRTVAMARSVVDRLVSGRLYGSAPTSLCFVRGRRPAPSQAQSPRSPLGCLERLVSLWQKAVDAPRSWHIPLRFSFITRLFEYGFSFFSPPLINPPVTGHFFRQPIPLFHVLRSLSVQINSLFFLHSRRSFS